QVKHLKETVIPVEIIPPAFQHHVKKCGKITVINRNSLGLTCGTGSEKQIQRSPCIWPTGSNLPGLGVTRLFSGRHSVPGETESSRALSSFSVYKSTLMPASAIIPMFRSTGLS